MENLDITQQTLKQPAGLKILFLTEMWERYGFYVVQGLLALLLTKHFGYSDSKCYALTGSFTSLAYIFTVLGGWYADQVLGYKHAIIWGGMLLIIGYAMMATLDENLLIPALATIVIGTGFFKANVSSLLGCFYHDNDPRRDAGYTIFYMGINVGILLSTLLTGFIQKWFSWNACFIAACLGLIIGLITFIYGQVRFVEYGNRAKILKNDWIRSFLADKLTILLVSIAFIYIVNLMMYSKNIADILLSITAVLVLLGLLYIMRAIPERRHRKKLIGLILLILASIIFWSVYFQIFMSVNLFIDRQVNRTISGFQIPTVAFISLEAFFILALGPILAMLWNRLNKNKAAQISFAVRFAFSFLAIAGAFLVLYYSTFFPNKDGLVAFQWIILAYFLVTLGEMLLSPIGLSAVTQLAPARHVGLLMGVWFISLGYGGKLAGEIANLTSIPKGITDSTAILSSYRHGFLVYSYLSLVFFLIMLIFVPRINRLQKGI